MNLRELAKVANVSISTASKAFRDAEDVSEQTKQAIFEVARQHGCFEKYYRQKYSKKIFAIICPELRSYLYAYAVGRLQKLIEAGGGIVLISTDDFDTRKQNELIDYYSVYLHVDGIFLFGKTSVTTDTPIICISSSESENDCILCDLVTPITEAVNHLIALGHRHIAFLGDPLTASKAEYFKEAVKKAKILHADLIQSPYRFETAGEDGMEKLLCLLSRPTAVICAYDYIAFGAIAHLTRNGFRVPEDLSVIGMDNIDSSQHTDPALTTIDSGYDESMQIAWDLMKKKTENDTYRLHQKITVTGRLIVRQTTGNIKNSERT